MRNIGESGNEREFMVTEVGFILVTFLFTFNLGLLIFLLVI